MIPIQQNRKQVEYKMLDNAGQAAVNRLLAKDWQIIAITSTAHYSVVHMVRYESEVASDG